MGFWRLWLVGALAGAALFLAPLLADEASLEDGRRLAGALRLDKAGRLRFAPEKGASVALADLTEVRLAPAPSPPFRQAGVRRLSLVDGQQLTGSFLGLEKQSLVLRTAWADKVAVPRAAVASLTHLPGWIATFEDDLRGQLKAWKAAGAPSSGPAGVRIERAGQALDHALPQPLPAGRIGVTFEAKDTPRGARWQLQAVFAGKPAPRVMRVTVAGPGAPYEVDSGGLDGSAARVARSPRPHRLVLQFSARSLRVMCDDHALWFNLEKGPPGPLRQVSLACVAADKEEIAGAVVWAELSVERAVPELPRAAGDPTQDELWLADGDQLFGKVVRAGRQEVALEGRFGTRALRWSALRGWFPRREPLRSRPRVAEGVRLSLRNGLDAVDDTLDGVVTALDDKHLTLRHALLGELRLERRRVVRVRPR